MELLGGREGAVAAYRKLNFIYFETLQLHTKLIFDTQKL